MRRIWAGSAIVVTAVVAAGCTGGALREESAGASSSRASVVKIGFIAPQSGPFANGGLDMQRGFRLYLDRHEGRLGGRKVDIVEVDEGAGPETGVPAVRRLIARDRVVAAVGIVNSAVALGSYQSFVDARIPLVIGTAAANALTGAKGSEFIWRASVANFEPNYAFGHWLARQPPIPGGVFFLSADYVAGREQLAGFKAGYTAAGGTIAGEQYSPFGTTHDFQPYLTQVRSSGAGAVYAFYAGQDAIGFVRQFRDFGLAGRIPLYGPGYLTEGQTLEAQGAAAEGIMTALNYSSELATPVNRAFVEAYETAYKATANAFAVQAYDAAAVLDAALGEIDGAVSGPAIVARLPKLGEIDSPRGVWRFNQHRNPDQHFYLRQVRREGDRFVNAVLADLGPVYWYVLAVTALAYGLIAAVRASAFGQALKGLRDNEDRMRALGYSVTGLKLAALAVAGGFAGLAGSLWLTQLRFVSPADVGFATSAVALVCVAIGGRGSLWGAFAATAVVVVVRDELGTVIGGRGPLVLGLTFIAVVYLLPRGLAGLVPSGLRLPATPAPATEPALATEPAQ